MRELERYYLVWGESADQRIRHLLPFLPWSPALQPTGTAATLSQPNFSDGCDAKWKVSLPGGVPRGTTWDKSLGGLWDCQTLGARGSPVGASIPAPQQEGTLGQQAAGMAPGSNMQPGLDWAL